MAQGWDTSKPELEPGPGEEATSTGMLMCTFGLGLTPVNLYTGSDPGRGTQLEFEV